MNERSIRMPTLTGSVTERVSMPAQQVFEVIADPHRLPQWNDRIHHVVEAPDHEPRPGDEWVVEMHALGGKWNSRSRVEELDHDQLRFVFVSRSDDGNPSYGVWTWRVDPAGSESDVSVHWELHPKTFWRAALFSRIRHRQLKEEVRASLRAVERVAS